MMSLSGLTYPVGFFLLLFLSHPFLMEVLKMGTLNINGARDRGKRGLVLEYAKQEKIHVMFLQETHSDDVNEVDWRVCWGGVQVFSHGTNVSAGVAVLFSPSLTVQIISQKEVCKGRLLIVWARIKGQVFTFINIYAPNTGRDRAGFFGALRQE